MRGSATPPAQDTLLRCIDACTECEQACTACSDACLREDMVAELVACIRKNADCADICAVTSAVLTRQTAPDIATIRTLLEACRTACASCAAECEQHAEMHEHCRVCAESYRRCEQACTDLLAAL
ncbi:four-helix bundle copper-binding protein [Microbacterium sp. OR21]